MGVDITGGALVGFIVSELKPVVAKHPRFQANAGKVLSAFNNTLAYNDISVTIANVRANGDRQSPDHFVATAMGQAMLAKLDGKPGTFAEWVQEMHPSKLVPGIYYLEVAEVNEATRAVRFILEEFNWQEGQGTGVGSLVYVDPRIPVSTVAPLDPSIEFKRLLTLNALKLLTYTEDLQLVHLSTGTPLVAGHEWWVAVVETHVLVESTTGGTQGGLKIPTGWYDLILEDQNGYVLRQGIDWRLTSEDTVSLAAWTPAKQKIIALGRWHKAPGNGIPVVHPENIFDLTKGAYADDLVLTQSTYSLNRGDFTEYIALPQGKVAFKHLVDTSDDYTWEFRVRRPQVYVSATKMAVNHELLPGLDVALGDSVVVGDRVAILVAPHRCETYEIYGAKDGVGFDITVTANDLLTVNELASMIRTYLLVDARDRLEAAGLSVFQIPSSYQGAARDASGTTSTHTVTLSVTAAADWEHYKPLINRVDGFDLSQITLLETYPGSPKLCSRVATLGTTRFAQAYI